MGLHQSGAVPTRSCSRASAAPRPGRHRRAPGSGHACGRPRGAHTRSVQRLHHDHLMLLCEGGGGLVQHIAAYRRGVGVSAADPALGALASVSTAACFVRLAGSYGPCWRAARRCSARKRACAAVSDFGARTRSISRPSGCGDDQQGVGFHPDIDTHHRVAVRPWRVRRRTLRGHDSLERAVPAARRCPESTSRTRSARSRPRSGGPVSAWTRGCWMRPDPGQRHVVPVGSTRIMPVVNRTSAGTGRT